MDRYRDLDKGDIVTCEDGVFVTSSKQTVAYDLAGNVVQEFESRQEKSAADIEHQVNFFNAMRSRRAEDLNAEIQDGHDSAGLCHMANVSHRLGNEATTLDALEKSFALGLWSDTCQRMMDHLSVHGIDLAKSPLTIGPWVSMDNESGLFRGPLAAEANQLSRSAYREPFVVPDLA